MPHLYPHKRAGWQIIFRVYFPDGTHCRKVKYAARKTDALLKFADIKALESMSRTGVLTKTEITRALNLKYITEDEAQKLSGSRISTNKTWQELIVQYEKWSKENCRPYTHICNESRLNVVIPFLLDKAPHEITKENIEGYISQRKKEGIKTATINKELIIIRKLLDYFDKDNVLPDDFGTTNLNLKLALPCFQVYNNGSSCLSVGELISLKQYNMVSNKEKRAFKGVGKSV